MVQDLDRVMQLAEPMTRTSDVGGVYKCQGGSEGRQECHQCRLVPRLLSAKTGLPMLTSVGLKGTAQHRGKG